MYKSLVSKTIIILLSFLIILALSLPILLKSLGLHPDFDSKTFNFLSSHPISRGISC